MKVLKAVGSQMGQWSIKPNQNTQNNVQTIRKFPKCEAEFLWLVYGNEQDYERVRSKLKEVLASMGDDAWLSVLEEFLFLMIDHRKEQNIFRIMSEISLPSKPETIELFTDRIVSIVNTLSLPSNTKYNILLVLWKLGIDCLDDYLKCEDKGLEESRNKYKYVCNNKIIKIIWGMAHCAENRIKATALTVLHFFIENYQSVQPLSMENDLKFFLQNSLVLNSDPEVELMTRYISRYSYLEPIQKIVVALDGEEKLNNKIEGKEKISLAPPSTSLLLDEDGLSVRNNSFRNQHCGLTENILEAVKGRKEFWYWEVTLSSLRYAKVGYTMIGVEVIGLFVPVTSNNQTFGFLVNEEIKSFQIYSKEGKISELLTKEKYTMFPCIELGPLQQAKFNLGKPILTILSNYRILSDIPCSSVKDSYTCNDKTFRQSVTLPFMQQEYNIEITDKLNKKDGKKSQATPKKTLDPDKEISIPLQTVRRSKSDKAGSPKVRRRIKSTKGEPSTPLFKSTGYLPEMNDDNIPYEYKCPISLSLMKDPVILPGEKQRFERSAIEQMLEKGSNRTPIAKVEFTREDIKSDKELRFEIKRWKRRSNK